MRFGLLSLCIRKPRQCNAEHFEKLVYPILCSKISIFPEARMPPHRTLLLALLLTWAAFVPVCLANSEAAPASHAAEGGELPEEEQRLGAFFLSMLLGIAFLVGYFLQTRHITWFPEAGAFLIIGVIAGAVFHSLKQVGDTNVDELAAYMKFNKEVFFMVLLPPIIFESAYNLRSRKFFANLDAILLLAVYGTLAATIVTGVLVKFAGDAGWSHPFDWLPSMLFGARKRWSLFGLGVPLLDAAAILQCGRLCSLFHQVQLSHTAGVDHANA